MQRLLLSRPLWAILALGAIAALAYGAAKSTREPPIADVIRAKHFLLVDGSGRKRMEWGDDVHSGGSGVTFYDRISVQPGFAVRRSHRHTAPPLRRRQRGPQSLPR